MKIWQIICLTALVLIAILMVSLIRNLRMMREIWQKKDEAEYKFIKDNEMTEHQKVFIGNVAHEMKTPLTAILTFAEILSVKQDITEEERKKYSGYIHEEAVHLKHMSEKLLQLVQFEGTNLQKREISLKHIIYEVLTTEQVICEKEGISLEQQLCECKLNGEKDLLKSLFYNLIDNARNASMKNGKILIHME